MPSTAEFNTLRFVALSPATEILRELTDNADLSIADLLHRRGEDDSGFAEEFSRRNLVALPDATISTRGRLCWYCIEAIEGGSILDLADKIRSLDPAASRISIVREGMTSRFVDLLARLDPIRRMMICSPWVNLDRARLRKVISVIEMSQKRRGFRPEITVVTRPPSDQPDGENNETLGYLRRIGALTYFNERLHSKLYIVESGEESIQRYAFVGSENFTKVRYQELGFFVDNDNLLIDDLIRYFLSLPGS